MRGWEDVVSFPEETIELMREIIREKREALRNRGVFVNTILREDVFDILNACCTVVFYPFLGDGNDGFQVARPVNYGGGPHIEQFVYLNTAKPLEKQVFAVGHELGHIWNVADRLWDGAPERMPPRERAEEDAMNRFAAELLMPEEAFRASALSQLDVYRAKNKLTYLNCIRVTASLMNEFCVPAAAVGLRLYETGCLSAKICERLLFTGPGTMPRERYLELFQESLSKCIQEGGYTRLGKPTNKKGIRDFPQILQEAENRGLLSSRKAAKLRSELDIPGMERNEIRLDEEDLNEEDLK